MSFQFFITKLLVRLSGSKQITGLPKEQMLKQIRRRNQLNRFFIPGDGKFDYRDEKVHVENMDGTTDGSGLSADFHCLSISHRDKPKRAVLCVYGGGLLLTPPRMFIGFAKKMAANTGADVWFPYYPLCDEYTIRDSVRMLYEVYAAMCRQYEDVRWYGYSSGGALLLLLGSYLNVIKSPLPMPQKLVLISPGGIPSTEEEWEKMQSLNGKDIMLSAQYMKTIQPLLSHGNATVPRWMQSCEGANFSGFPETWIYYGTSEVLSAKAAAYDEMLTSAGVRHHLKMAPGMPHCYCTTVFFPEAKADYEETMQILRED
jgi:acetyl esterase/lipase